MSISGSPHARVRISSEVVSTPNMSISNDDLFDSPPTTPLTPLTPTGSPSSELSQATERFLMRRLHSVAKAIVVAVGLRKSKRERLADEEKSAKSVASRASAVERLNHLNTSHSSNGGGSGGGGKGNGNINTIGVVETSLNTADSNRSSSEGAVETTTTTIAAVETVTLQVLTEDDDNVKVINNDTVLETPSESIITISPSTVTASESVASFSPSSSPHHQNQTPLAQEESASPSSHQAPLNNSNNESHTHTYTLTTADADADHANSAVNAVVTTAVTAVSCNINNTDDTTTNELIISENHPDILTTTIKKDNDDIIVTSIDIDTEKNIFSTTSPIVPPTPQNGLLMGDLLLDNDNDMVVSQQNNLASSTEALAVEEAAVLLNPTEVESVHDNGHSACIILPQSPSVTNLLQSSAPFEEAPENNDVINCQWGPNLYPSVVLSLNLSSLLIGETKVVTDNDVGTNEWGPNLYPSVVISLNLSSLLLDHHTDSTSLSKSKGEGTKTESEDKENDANETSSTHPLELSGFVYKDAPRSTDMDKNRSRFSRILSSAVNFIAPSTAFRRRHAELRGTRIWYSSRGRSVDLDTVASVKVIIPSSNTPYLPGPAFVLHTDARNFTFCPDPPSLTEANRWAAAIQLKIDAATLERGTVSPRSLRFLTKVDSIAVIPTDTAEKTTTPPTPPTSTPTSRRKLFKKPAKTPSTSTPVTTTSPLTTSEVTTTFPLTTQIIEVLTIAKSPQEQSASIQARIDASIALHDARGIRVARAAFRSSRASATVRSSSSTIGGGSGSGSGSSSNGGFGPQRLCLPLSTRSLVGAAALTEAWRRVSESIKNLDLANQIAAGARNGSPSRFLAKRAAACVSESFDWLREIVANTDGTDDSMSLGLMRENFSHISIIDWGAGAVMCSPHPKVVVDNDETGEGDNLFMMQISGVAALDEAGFPLASPSAAALIALNNRLPDDAGCTVSQLPAIINVNSNSIVRSSGSESSDLT